MIRKLKDTYPKHIILFLFFGLILLIAYNLYGEKNQHAMVDERSGLTWDTLLNGEIPEDHFWEYINPQRKYLRENFGNEISTTYDLYLKEIKSHEQMNPGIRDLRILENKSMKRWPDPVIFNGKALGEWTGRRLDQIRVYALHLGKLIPIPYQFDELTTEGKKVLPDGGPEANPQDGNNVLDPYDEFLFMAHDLGDRIKPEQWINGFEDALEITVTDPLDNTKGWCYLLYFQENVPSRSPLNYATYNDKYNQHYGFYLFEQSNFKVMGDKLYRQIFNKEWKIPDFAGGNFTNFIDRQKFRVKVRLFFGSVKINTTEDDFSGDTLALRDGPVRCNRRVWGQVRLPLGFKTPKIIGDIIGYDTMFVCPVKISIPINPGLVLTDLTLYSGTDLNPETVGSRWYNSNNLNGFLIDGKATENEISMNKMIDQWRLITGPWGTMMNRSTWDPGFLSQAKIRIEFTDDTKLKDPPEYYEGQIGMSYNYSTVKNLKAGEYIVELDWFFIPWFQQPKDAGKLNMDMVSQYITMYKHPLQISIGGDEMFINQPRPTYAK